MKVDLTKQELQLILNTLAQRPWQEVEGIIHKLDPYLTEENNETVKK